MRLPRCGKCAPQAQLHCARRANFIAAQSAALIKASRLLRGGSIHFGRNLLFLTEIHAHLPLLPLRGAVLFQNGGDALVGIEQFGDGGIVV